MKWPDWLLPWAEHRNLRAAREHAEHRAREVEHNIAAPLRAMRTYDYLTQAVAEEIRRQATEHGTGQ